MTDDMPRTVTVGDDRLVELVEAGNDPIRTVPEMAAEINLTPDGLRRRLLDLEERGRVQSKSVGANAVVWWS